MPDISLNEAVQLLKEAEQMERTDLLKMRDLRLKTLVEYARNNSPYFANHYKNLPDNWTLTDLPPTSKKELMCDYEQWVTDREIKLSEVLEYVNAPDKESRKFLGRYTGLTTSGTTGEPMPMLRDNYHNTIHGAMIANRLCRGGIANFMDQTKYKIAAVIYTGPSASSYGSFLRMKNSKPEFAHNMLAISPLEGTQAILQKLNEFQPDILSCYPSAMCAIAAEKEAGNVNFAPKIIFCSAETLTPQMHQYLSKTFNCPVLNNYCSTEGGELAMSCHNGYLHINEDWVIIEPVGEDRLSPAKADGLSSGVLITDLTNFVQPVIRYFVEDNVQVYPADCQCGQNFLRLNIAGRTAGTAKICGRNIMLVQLAYIIVKLNTPHLVQFVHRSPYILEIRTDAKEEEYMRVMHFAKNALAEILDKENCTTYQIFPSQELPIRNNRGGKVSTYIRLFEGD